MSSPSAAARRVGHRIAARRDDALAEPAHDARTAAILGIALGVCFSVCFATGLLSHALQHPPSWFDWPSRPAGLYRITQGLHVISGTAAIPLLLAKLWSVYPRLFLPLRANTADVLERVSLVPLVGGSIFMLFTGTANIARWYPWRFFFPRGHYWVAWVTIGALIVHIGARQASARAALARGGASAIRSPAPAADRVPAIGRRALLAWAGAASAGLTLTTAGQTVGFLRAAVMFAPRRPDIGTQGLPVNKAAGEAGVEQSARDPNWRLVIEAEGEERLALDLVQLEALPRRRAELPIACVEGWSRSASWGGVPMRDLLDRVQVASYDEVDVISLEDGLYGRSTLSARQVRDRDTMLALELNGERLNLDHGYPVRLITPNRPGVLQTKWVTRLVVR